MHEYDKKILELVPILLLDKKISSKGEFYDEVKILRQTITKIKQGINHFTSVQIQIICKKYNVNANWIFNLEKNIYINSKSSDSND